MKKVRLLFLIPCLVFSLPLFAATIPEDPKPVSSPAASITVQDLVKLSPRQFQQRSGRKLTFKERIAYRLLQWKLRKQYRQGGEPTPKQLRLGTLSLIFGLGALLVLFLPYIGLLSIGLAIAGFVLGLKSIRGNSNAAGLIGLIASSLVLFIFILAALVLATTLPYE